MARQPDHSCAAGPDRRPSGNGRGGPSAGSPGAGEAANHDAPRFHNPAPRPLRPARSVHLRLQASEASCRAQGTPGTGTPESPLDELTGGARSGVHHSLWRLHPVPDTWASLNRGGLEYPADRSIDRTSSASQQTSRAHGCQDQPDRPKGWRVIDRYGRQASSNCGQGLGAGWTLGTELARNQRRQQLDRTATAADSTGPAPVSHRWISRFPGGSFLSGNLVGS